MCGGSVPLAGSSDPWYDLPINKQYQNAFLDGYTEGIDHIYRSGYQISSDYVGQSISQAVTESSSPVNNEMKRYYAEAYYIRGYSDENVVAIRFEGYDEYYLYLTNDTDLDNIKKQIPPIEQ